MRLRRADCLLCEFMGTRARITNAISRRSCLVSSDLLRAIAQLDDDLDDCTARSALQTQEAVYALIRAHVLLEVGSAMDQSDREHFEKWKFGLPSLSLAFGHDPLAPVSWPVRTARLRERLGHMPALQLDHEADDQTLHLPPPAPQASELIAIMSRRRSCRAFDDRAISAEQFSAVAFAAAGRTGTYSDRILGTHPLTTSPSGGARNPFELFVIIDRIESVPSGNYFYDGRGCLHPVAGRRLDLSRVTGDQPWFGSAAAAIVLVGWPDRTWSKYPQPRAFLSFVVEAGHRAQNALLAATAAGLGGCVTLNVASEVSKEAFGLDPVDHPAFYLIALGRPKATVTQAAG